MLSARVNRSHPISRQGSLGRPPSRQPSLGPREQLEAQRAALEDAGEDGSGSGAKEEGDGSGNGTKEGGVAAPVAAPPPPPPGEAQPAVALPTKPAAAASAGAAGGGASLARQQGGEGLIPARQGFRGPSRVVPYINISLPANLVAAMESTPLFAGSTPRGGAGDDNLKPSWVQVWACALC